MSAELFRKDTVPAMQWNRPGSQGEVVSTKVRLTDAEEFPDHRRIDRPPCDLNNPEIWSRYRGTVITIGVPAPPKVKWNCGTDVVFPVLDIQLQAPEIERGLYPYGSVCRHQIQAGD